MFPAVVLLLELIITWNILIIGVGNALGLKFLILKSEAILQRFPFLVG